MADERSVNRKPPDERERIVSGEEQGVPEKGSEKSVDYAPALALREMIGRPAARQDADLVDAARGRGDTLDHILLYGPPGLGTTLSHIMAHEMNANLKVTAGPAIEKAGDLAAILQYLRRGGILFIDEIHRLGRGRRDPLSGHGGFCARYRGGQRAWRVTYASACPSLRSSALPRAWRCSPRPCKPASASSSASTSTRRTHPGDRQARCRQT